MKRPITLCSGQFGDMPLEELCREMTQIGYDGFEFATQAHVDINGIVNDAEYRKNWLRTIEKYNVRIGALSGSFRYSFTTLPVVMTRSA